VADLEDAVWQDILDLLYNPHPILAKLAEQLQSRHTQTQDLEQERLATALALSHKDAEKEDMLNLYRHGHITSADLERQLDNIATEAAELKGRLASLETTLQGQEAIATRLLEARELLDSLRAELKQDYSWEEKRKLVETLVLKLLVHSPERIVVTYAFDDCAATCTSTASAVPSPPRVAPRSMRSTMTQ